MIIIILNIIIITGKKRRKKNGLKSLGSLRASASGVPNHFVF